MEKSGPVTSLSTVRMSFDFGYYTNYSGTGRDKQMSCLAEKEFLVGLMGLLENF